MKYCLVCRDPHTTQPTKGFVHCSHVSKSSRGKKKQNSYFPEKNWLFNRDPYNCLRQSLYNWIVFHPLYNPTNQLRGAPVNHENPSHQGWRKHGKKNAIWKYSFRKLPVVAVVVVVAKIHRSVSTVRRTSREEKTAGFPWRDSKRWQKPKNKAKRPLIWGCFSAFQADFVSCSANWSIYLLKDF